MIVLLGPSLREKRRWLSPSEIARRRKGQRKWKGREIVSDEKSKSVVRHFNPGGEEKGEKVGAAKIGRRGDVFVLRELFYRFPTARKKYVLKYYILAQRPFES